MQWPTALICVLALTCCNCRSAPPPSSSYTGSTVAGQPAPIPANSVPNLAVESEAQQRRDFPTTDFAFGFETNDVETPAGTQSMLFVNNNQALATLPGDGVGQNLITLEPCAINQPHVHPRGTEISFITKGEILFGFIEENLNRAGTAGGRFINATVAVGQTFIIPQGLVHFSQNLQCEQAQFISTFPSSDPGTSTVSTALFDLPMSALRATLGLDNEAIQVIVDKVKSVQQRNPSFDTECLAQCNIPEPEFSS